MAIFGTGQRLGMGLLRDTRTEEEKQRELESLLDPISPKPASFWQGGEKFRGKDAIAGLLAVLGDAFTQQSGGDPYAVQGLSGGRQSAMEKAEKAAQERALMAAAQRQGINADQFALYQGGMGAAIPKPPEDPSEVRVTRWYQNASPEERAAYDQMHPIITHGYGSTVIPRSGLQSPGAGNQDAIPTREDGFDYIPGPGGRANPANWKQAGGGGGNATGGFRPYRR